MSTVKSTLKLETGSFSEYKIYPGRGIRHISRDGKSYFFINSKCKSLYHQRVKPARLTWTQVKTNSNKKSLILFSCMIARHGAVLIKSFLLHKRQQSDELVVVTKYKKLLLDYLWMI
jgi:ribosomal protein L24E